METFSYKIVFASGHEIVFNDVTISPDEAGKIARDIMDEEGDRQAFKVEVI